MQIIIIIKKYNYIYTVKMGHTNDRQTLLVIFWPGKLSTSAVKSLKHDPPSHEGKVAEATAVLMLKPLD